MPEQVGCRVKVHSGDGSKYLGEGTYVGDVPVFAVDGINAEGQRTILSNPNAMDVRPTEEEVASWGLTDWKIRELPSNPKLVMDDGGVYYGCQVWWQAIPG